MQLQSNDVALVPIDRYRPLVQMVTDSLPSPSAKDCYGRKLRVFLAWWEATGARPFSRQLVQEFVEGLRSENHKAYDIGHYLKAIRAMAREAAYNGHLGAVEMQGVLAIKAPQNRGTRLGNWLSEDQVRTLWTLPDRSTLAGKRDLVLLGFLACCGLRRDEAKRVRFEHVKIIEGRPVIANFEGKGGKTRSVPMPHWLFRAIQEWVDAAGLDGGVIIRALEGWKGKPGPGEMNSSSIWVIIKRYAQKLGVPDLAPHDFRRTYGRIARAHNIPLDQIQETYGHEDLRTTQRYIGGVTDFANPPCDAIPTPLGF